ncbi:MAG: glycosyltransferase [Candidatus Woesearchaeota archaeon]
MKIAILHTSMDVIGGAEKVVLILAKELKADIYTTNVNKKIIKTMGFPTNNIFSIGKIPVNPPYRQQAAMMRFRFFSFPKYDTYIVAGDWAISAAKTIPVDIWYVHSPMRELFDLYEFTKKNIVPFGKQSLFSLWATFMRFLVRGYSQKVQTILCNSKNTKKRVLKYLCRDARVVYPPIQKIHSQAKNENTQSYWLSVNRLITHKRVELQLKAFEKLPNEELFIVGSYENAKHFQTYANKIQQSKPANVQIKSWVSEKDLQKLYANCKGFITTAKDEDFGMTVVEAMAHGKTVIAPNEGRYKESIIDKKTGYLVDAITVKKLIRAIEHFKPCNPKVCKQQASKFDSRHFTKQIRAIIHENKK